MRLLHTADWHLNDRLGRRDRTGHLRTRVERVAVICEEEKIDVIALAGDIFSEQAKPFDIAESLAHLRKTFREFFRRGGTIVAITGNHDQDGRVRPHLDVARAALDLADPPRQNGELLPPGKFYLVDSPYFGRVRGSDGLQVQLVLLPFLNHSRMNLVLGQPATPEELHRPIAQRASSWLRGLRNETCFDPRLRTVLMAHMTVHGCELSAGRFRLSEQYDVIADSNDLSSGWDYVALGHIHKPQVLRGQSHVRYSGSLDRLDFAERDEDKGVVLVDIGPEGLRGEPRFIPILPTPFVHLHISDPALSVSQVKAQAPEPEQSVIQVTVEAAAAADVSAGAVERLVYQSLPKQSVAMFTCEVPELNNGVGGAAAFKAEPTVRETVLKYLRDTLTEADPQRAELLALAETFLGDSQSVREEQA